MINEGLRRATVHPITDDDLSDVGLFLGANFPPDTLGDQWAQAWRVSVNLPGSDAPNHGFLLRAGEEVVGAYPVIYSTRIINGRRERFANLAVWYVRPEYRRHSFAMLRAILAQPGLHLTDLTPIDLVQRINARLGFQYLDTDTALVVNLPWPTIPGRTRVNDHPAVVAASLAEPERTYYADHAACRWARHLVLIRGPESCYVQWRIERRKGRPWFASIQYASHPQLLRREFRTVSRYFLLRHRAPFTLAEIRVADGRIHPSILLRNHRPRMFRSETLPPDQIDYLYSEITSAP